MKKGHMLTDRQKQIMTEFYRIVPKHIIYDKNMRDDLWYAAKHRDITGNDLRTIAELCPALSHQIEKSYESGNNIQSAVFSECVYSQTLAKMFRLNNFYNCCDDGNCIPEDIKKLLKPHNIEPRYVYYTKDKKRMLIQAGGCGGIDCVLVDGKEIYTIEFKEQGAKTSEADLPKYGEDGKLRVTDKFLAKYPQFEEMLKEQKDLNFFEHMGSNIHGFSEESVNIAVSENYMKKYADVICTEDCNGYLVMLPANQVAQWAVIEGEIRPAGRNPYKVWTPKKLKKILLKLGADISEENVSVERSKLTDRKERGGNRVSGYKINPLFFVRVEDCKITKEKVSFDISSVWQLNPTIAGKMFFYDLQYDEVYNYYERFLV